MGDFFVAFVDNGGKIGVVEGEAGWSCVGVFAPSGEYGVEYSGYGVGCELITNPPWPMYLRVKLRRDRLGIRNDGSGKNPGINSINLL
jgi:hypothetical protein